MDKALLVLFKVIIDKKCKADEELKGLVGRYIQKLSEVAAIRDVIKGYIDKMSEKERSTLQIYIH